MVTKAQGVDWGELIDFEDELFDWLVERKLAKPGERSLSTVLKLRHHADDLDPLASAVASAIYEIRAFVGAGIRADRADREKLLAKAGLDAKTTLVLFDDTIERQADAAIRAMAPKLAHIRRLTESIAKRLTERAAARRQEPNQKRIDFLRNLVFWQLEHVEDEVTALHVMFLLLSPSMQHEELTLAGCRAFERRIRKSLTEAGYHTTRVRKTRRSRK